LAILLRTGTSTETVLELANQLLSQAKGLRFLAEASLD
jgi:DNA repair protein RadC